MCEDLFTAVMSATDNDNRLLSAAFQLLPSKKVIIGFIAFILIYIILLLTKERIKYFK